MPIKHLNEQQFCACGNFYQICDYEGEVIEYGIYNFHKDIDIIQDLVVDKTFVMAPWINFETDLETDLKILKELIIEYTLCN